MVSHVGMETPFAVSGSVLQDIMREQSMVEDLQHVEANPVSEEGYCLGGVGMPSSSGGIPVENVVLEEISSGEENDVFFENDRAKLERDTVNRAAKAVFAANRDERDELIELRRKFMEMQRLLEKKGISMAELEKGMIKETVAFNVGLADPSMFISGRDEFGLPIFTKHTASNMFGNGPNRMEDLGRESTGKEVPQVFDTSPEKEDIGVSGVKDSDGKEKHSKPASWSQVVRSVPILSNSVKLDYVPLPEGVKVVAPPIEVLKKGNDKLRNCIVGSISKGNVSFGRVSAFAHHVWDKRGLLSVFQKDNATFIFKFDSELSMNNVLASGTWYIGSTPMLVHAWGIDIHTESVKSIPLWVKLEKIPDCYWTQEGLSNLASIVGRPLGADALTSRLEILPFVKVCVEYIVGNDLPSKIEAMNLNPVTEEMTVVEVVVSYPNKPRVCSGCKALGHIVGACPITKRQWVQKPKVATDDKKGDDEHPVISETDKLDPDVSTPTHNLDNIANDEGDWHTVPHKRAFSPASVAYSDNSPTPLNTFKNLTRVGTQKELLSPPFRNGSRKRERRLWGSLLNVLLNCL
ncbi:hypothetical protein POM88_005303 [Heracleum sosnowskyi]|uniref:DUF4283 domain-containing protein n=1 Tax=Heracleum sosnowskyi TaxID=360622 RepID=A0AAD8JL03_9APIA|nr:hypothetical protein POM88_005303 [Heracleum sosnowskyi]